jgi:hypothetical protein
VHPSRLLAVALFAGGLVVTAVPSAQAMDPYTQGLLLQTLSGLVLGNPTGSYGAPPYGATGASPYDPYGNSPYGSYRRPLPGAYGVPPPYGPSGMSGGYGLPLPGPYGSSPSDYYRGGYGYRYPSRRNYDYTKAMTRLNRQEAEAQAKAYRRSYGNPARYNERMAKIERKYDYKRYKVERNTRRGY